MKVSPLKQKNIQRYFVYGKEQRTDATQLYTLKPSPCATVNLYYIGLRIVDPGQCVFRANGGILDIKAGSEIYTELAIYTSFTTEGGEFTYQTIMCDWYVFKLILYMGTFLDDSGLLYISGLAGYLDKYTEKLVDIPSMMDKYTLVQDESAHDLTYFYVHERNEPDSDLQKFIDEVPAEWSPTKIDDVVIQIDPPCKSFVIWNKYISNFLALVLKHNLRSTENQYAKLISRKTATKRNRFLDLYYEVTEDRTVFRYYQKFLIKLYEYCGYYHDDRTYI